MEQLTIRIATDTLEALETAAAERDVSKSEVAREWIELGSEYDSLQAENDRLHRRIEALIQQREAHQELVEYVSEERQLQRQERERRNANVIQRAKLWVFGRE
jgi:chromosome segregation ATPase